MVFRERITELEKENLVQSKENYMLNSELDYENARTGQLKSKNDNILAGATFKSQADSRAKDRLIAEYERKLGEADVKARLQAQMDGDQVHKYDE